MPAPSHSKTAVKISVVIPCFNAERYIAQTLGSVIEQSLTPLEIIVIDDGSTDTSLQIARRFAAAYPQLLRVYSQRSGSATRTRNLGAAISRGNALMFLDADDLIDPDVLAALAAALETTPGAIAACPWRRLYLDAGNWVGRSASCAPRRAGDDPLSAWLSGWYYPPCSILWSRDAFQQTGGWDESAVVNQDGDLIMRALVSGIPLLQTESGIAYYREAPAGETSLSGKQKTHSGLQARIGIIEKIACLLNERGQLHLYHAPLSRAFGHIATDAAGSYAGIYQRALCRQKQFAPPFWRRLWERNGPWRLRQSISWPTAGPRSKASEPVHFGEACARQVLASVETEIQRRAPLPPAPPAAPRVSVVIPVYNRAQLLQRSIGSVLGQSMTDFEILVVDDCSVDDPESVIRAFADPRIRYLRQSKNQGVAAARNRGLRESRASLVAFLDDDDEWLPQKLAQQVQLFAASPADLGLIYTGVETITDTGPPQLMKPSAHGDLYRDMLVRNLLHGGSSAMIRRNVINQVGFFDERLPAIEDYDFWLRIARHYKFEAISTPLVRYYDTRSTPESEGRRSLNIRANLAARDQFYRKHGAQMRAAGVAHMFLMESARRHLPPHWNDPHGARRLTARAFLLAPTSWEIRQILPKLIAGKPAIAPDQGNRPRAEQFHG